MSYHCPAMTDSTITLYDIPCKEGISWSPNIWKTRYSLNFKGIPYKTVWVEYPEIEPLCKKLGAEPTGKKDDGKPRYTLPVIHDPTTGVTLSESSRIAEYLDKTYPNKPLLIPTGTRALQRAFQEIFPTKLSALWQFLLPKTTWALNPISEEFFRRTRLQRFNGLTMEELYPSGEKKKAEWKKLEEDLGSIDKWMRKEDVFMMGDTPSYADLTIAGFVIWVRMLYGVDSEEWKDVERWHEGRWGRLLKSLEKYETSA